MVMTETAQDLSTIPASLSLPDTRTGVIFWRTLRDNLSGVMGWGVGFSVLITVATVLYPLLDQSNAIFTVLNGLGVLDFLTEGRDIESLTNFPGYLALQVISWVPIILSIYLVPQAIAAIALEERQGTLDILLSTPISRWRFLLEKSLAVVVSLLGILSLTGIGMWISSALLNDVSLDVNNIISSMWHVVPVSLVIFTGTLLLSVIIRDHRKAGGFASLLLLVNYFTRNLGNFVTSDVLESIKPFSIFYYYRSVPALGEGFQWWADVRLLALAGVLFVLCVMAFQRRDLGV